MSIESHREAVRAYKKRHIAAGLCPFCALPAAPGKRLCRVHLKQNADSNIKVSSKRRQRYRDEGRCTRCSAPLDPDCDPGHVECINCREGKNEKFNAKCFKSIF